MLSRLAQQEFRDHGVGPEPEALDSRASDDPLSSREIFVSRVLLQASYHHWINFRASGGILLIGLGILHSEVVWQASHTQ